MKQVYILALNKALGTSIGIPLEMLNAANDIARSKKLFDKILPIDVVSQNREPVSLAGGLSIKASRCIEILAGGIHSSDNDTQRIEEPTENDSHKISNINPISDTHINPIRDTHRTSSIDTHRTLKSQIQGNLIFIPTFWGNPLTILRKHRKAIAWLKRQHELGATICSVGTGSYLLAEAGILDGKIATTHWYYFDNFQDRYRSIKLQRKRFITRADNVFCTGSINAVRDLMIFLIEQLYDESVANQVSRHFTHELKRSYESLLLSKDQHNTHHDEVIIKVQEWLQDNLQSQVRLMFLATQFKMSVRSLNRRFKTAAGKSPLQYLQELRIDQAKSLLKQSNLDISEIAYRVGYSDASYFSGLFRKFNAVSPNEYRNLVRNKLFVTEAITGTEIPDREK